MKDMSREEALAHFVVRGMRWGVRNETVYSPKESSQKPRMSKKKKVAIGVSVAALTAGAAAAVVVLNKNGDLPVSQIFKEAGTLVRDRRKNKPELWNDYPRDISRTRDGKTWESKIHEYQKTTERGAKTVKHLADDTDTFKKLMREFDASIAEAHKDETEWMRRNVPTYNPHTDPYIPKYELDRLRGRS